MGSEFLNTLHKQAARQCAGERDTAPAPIAIVGIGCRLPGNVMDPTSFWNLLTEGRSGIREVPADRWNNSRFYHPDPECLDSIISKWGGFVNDLDKFDARFWGVSPREAMRMDPQQRWLLEVAWEAIEDGGTAPSKLRGQEVGVFVGISSNDYGGLQVPYHEIIDAYTNSGSTASIASNRISYMLDLKGPSLSVDTACSSSLVAVWLACESIWTGKCTAALAGGVNALVTPHASVGFSRASMLSRSGQCYAFDARANGYVRGEGVGVVYLKPLVQAIADHDRVYAVIRGAAANQDGHTSSMTVPGVEGQSAMLRSAYQSAQVDPRRIVYIEAHGTGTPVGDPIELTALGQVLGQGRRPDDRILIGSVKTNIGHLESGSGVAGLIKAALVLHHRTVPKSLNFEQPNPNIPFERLSLRVASSTEALPQPPMDLPVVGVNSFGFGGTNAHVVLESSPVQQPEPVSTSAACSRPLVLTISARDDEALRRNVRAFVQRLSDASLRLPEFCTSSGQRKEHHDRRLVVIAQDRPQFQRRLEAWLAGAEQVRGVYVGRPSKSTKGLTFVYTGQGSQWWAMGQQLIQREPIFRAQLESIDHLLQPLCGWSLLDKLQATREFSEIDRTDVAQPAIFALQVALTALWKSWGILPSQVIGHSVGEVAAAYCAGIYSLEDAVRIIFERSRLQHTTGGRGRMLVVGISAKMAEQAIGADRELIQVAVINNPNLVTLSGDTLPLERLGERFQAENRFLRWLPIDYAFHTHQMDPIREELIHCLRDIQPQTAKIPFYSTVTAGALSGAELSGEYWWRNVREPVLFGPAILEMLAARPCHFLEIGPHPALATSLRDCNAAAQRDGLVLHSLRRESDDSAELLGNLAQLHLEGKTIEWASVNRSSRAPERLPSYAWSHESFWLETAESKRTRIAPLDHVLLGVRTGSAIPTWTLELDLHRLAFLSDHRLWDNVVFPGAAYAEMGQAVAKLLFPNEQLVVDNLAFHKALFVVANDPPVLQTTWTADTKTFSIFSRARSKSEWELNATGQLQTPTNLFPGQIVVRDLPTLQENLVREEIAAEFHRAGFQFGPNFLLLDSACRGNGQAIGWIQPTQVCRDNATDFYLHPAILDACFQLSAVTRVASEKATDNFFLPKSVRNIQLFQPHALSQLEPESRLIVCAKLVENHPTAVESDIQLYTENGEPVAEIRGFRSELGPLSSASTQLSQCSYRMVWQPTRLKGTWANGSCHFPDNQTLVERLIPSIHSQYSDTRGDAYFKEFVPQINALVPGIVISAYLDLGWQPSTGDRFSTRQIIDQLGIAPKFQRLINSQLHQLVQAGTLQAIEPNEWEVAVVPHRCDFIDQLSQMEEQFGFHDEIQVIRKASLNLASVLCGDVDPVQLLFTGGSSDMMSKFYSRANEFLRFHELIRRLLRDTLQHLPERRCIRVLEVGGGTASLTRSILDIFPADRTEYTFTDIGAGFLSSGKSLLREFAFVDYRVFDLEKEAQAQGFDTHAFDLILATNVLHATSDLAKSLSNLKNCLASDGLVLFLETLGTLTYPENLVFGLLDGWWKFTDVHLRQQSPLIGRDQWEQLLTDVGYHQIASFSSTVCSSDAAQAVFLARGPEITSSAADETQANIKGSALVIFGDRGGLAARIGQRFAHSSQTIQVEVGRAYEHIEANRFRIDPANSDDYVLLFKTLREQGHETFELLHAWSLDVPDASVLNSEQMSQVQDLGVLSVLSLLRCDANVPKLWILAEHVFSVEAEDSCSGIASSAMVGLVRVANNERYPRRAYLLDIGDDRSDKLVDAVVKELSSTHNDLEIGFRQGMRYVHQIVRSQLDEMPLRHLSVDAHESSRPAFRLESRAEGILTNLEWRRTIRRHPGPNEIEVHVQAGGINFRDVMKALGTYPGNPIDLHWYGDDFSGTVISVGESVSNIRVGDRVAGMAPYAFQSHVIVDARLVFRLPDSMTFEQAATLPTVFLTAHYAIHHLARMAPGESILIHGGTGGVGQAAIQIAQRLGLEIFATAGSDEKRQLLRDQGVPHVLNSRSLEFADRIRDITQGRGVDAVLNSLAGAFIPKSLELLAPYGRFLEIGKIDIYNNSKIGLRQFKDNISYFVIDLGQHLLCRQAHAGQLFAEIAEQISAGNYRPLPLTSFPISQCVEAFRRMAQGKHIGKNVLTFDDPQLMIGPDSDPQRQFCSHGTYLISGGAGGFGWEVAKAMVAHGARNLVLLSRSGPREVERQQIENLRATGINIVDTRADVTKFNEVQQVIEGMAKSMPPLVGVIHGAMVLDDDFISELTLTRFRTALDVKVLGGWNLHLATGHLPLQEFVCFSSFSSVFGAPKQANYNAGNYFLDALAHYRRSQGLVAQTIDWGALLGAGFVERNRKTAEYLDKIGLAAFSMAEATEGFQRAIKIACSQISLSRVDWNKLGAIAPTVKESSMFAGIMHASCNSELGGSLAARLRAVPATERLNLMQSFIAAQIAGVFGVAESQIERDTPLTQMGLDSLMALELKNRVEKEAGIALPMNEILNGPSLTQLASVVLKHIDGSPTNSEPQADQIQPTEPTVVAPADELLARLDELPEDEIDRLLAQLESSDTIKS